MLLHNPFLRRSASRSVTSGRVRTWGRDRLMVESLEIRNLLSATWPGLIDPQLEAESNNTLDIAEVAGNVSAGEAVEFAGRVDSATDVDWLTFTLESAGRVQIRSMPGGSGAAAPVVLTLYGDQLAEFDPAFPLQHQMLGRREGNSNSPARPIDLRLEAGTYFLAVSGAGNRHFHPFVANSGVPGLASDYGISITVTSGSAPTSSQDQFASLLETGRRGDDTSATASDLGDLTALQRLQVSGTIGDDRFYDLASKNPFAMNSASDVDLYRFSITGDGTFGLIAEAFAGRIGSALDTALSLFQADDVGALQLVAINNNSLNPTESTNGQIPFFSDSVLFAGLTAGEYFLAVSSSGNEAESDPDGAFDPQIAHSGLNGGSIGNYVLDLSVVADNVAPRVVGQVFNLPGSDNVRLSAGQVGNLPHAPTHLSLRFSETVNLQQLAYAAYLQTSQNTVRAVFIEAADGTHYFPRLQSYDTETGIARFLILDGLPNGDFELHVSGDLGITDLAGNPIADSVRQFTVADASRVADPGFRSNASGNETFETAQDLGVLFPHELQSGVKLVRDAVTNAGQPADSADYFRFELLQSQSYFFTLSNFGDGAPPAIEVLNSAGQVMSLTSLPGGQGVLGYLPAGSYVLHLGAWNTADSHNVTYQIEMELGGASENPTPLTNGAAPAVGIRLAGHGPAAVHVAPVVTVASQSQSSPQFIGMPSGLLQGLNAPALGGQDFATPVFTPNTALVRLFGFGNRDRLFSLIDSTLPRTSESPEITKAELTDAELRELLKSNRKVSDETNADSTNSDAATEPSTDGEMPTEEPVTTETLESDNSASTSGEQSPVPQKRPVSSGRATQTSQLEIRTPTEKQPSAFSAPIALALATSLASTLRERSRREKKELRITNYE